MKKRTVRRWMMTDTDEHGVVRLINMAGDEKADIERVILLLQDKEPFVGHRLHVVEVEITWTEPADGRLFAR